MGHDLGALPKVVPLGFGTLFEDPLFRVSGLGLRV